jgi:two-component system, chemotaxis family, CheB/CheR fusion protein
MRRKPTPRRRAAKARDVDSAPTRRDPSVATAAGPVVGIGASAGGLEALQALFRAVGTRTGLSFVVVTHLSPDHESLLGEILGRSTTMPVTQVRTPTPALPDHVYVIAPGKDLTIEGGVLRTVDRRDDGAQHLPVDRFLAALAADRGNQSIGVILSGGSNDGNVGLKAVKAAGGITFAQDVRSALHGEMPRSAAVAGVVDFVLPPEQIARELSRLTGHAYVAEPPTDGETLDATQVDRILRAVRAATGADFSYYKPGTVRRRILRRMALGRLESLAAYADVVERDRAEAEALYDDVLINVTSFFRDPEAFRTLDKRAFPALFPRKPRPHGARVWVPGCSSGEEAYSLAIAALEFVGDREAEARLQVFGTDVSERVIARARAGRYPASIAAEVSPARLRRFFNRLPDGQYQVSKAVRDLCVFAKHDLLRDPPFGRMDLVSCRNVLIYFGPVLQARAIALFHYALRTDGFLLLGASEQIVAQPELFTLVDKQHRLYVRKAVPSRLSFERTARGDAAPLPRAAVRDLDARAGDIQREADRIAISRFVPAGVVVDDDMQIVQFRGATGPFLEPRTGTASLNLLKMAREGLVLELRSAFQRARRDGTPVRRERVRMRTDDHLAEVALEVIPFPTRHAGARLYLVTFEMGAAKPVVTAARQAKRRRGASAEQELAATRDYLQTIIEEQEATNEELMSANEEILSSNEELQSTNEELETAKEELQSSNEELSTVNDELQSRNAELSRLNADLSNVIGTIHLPLVLLDDELRVRRATPAADRLLNLIPSDVGRRITDLRPNVDLSALPRTVAEVLETSEARDVDVRDDHGRWLSMAVRPYRTEKRTEGVVVVWLDVHASKASLGEASDAGQAALLSAFDQPAAIVGPGLRVVARNEAWASDVGPGDVLDGETSDEVRRMLAGLSRMDVGSATITDARGRRRAVRARRLGGEGEPVAVVTLASEATS